jgi:hypothetical protein
MFVPKYPQSYLFSQITKPFQANIQINWMWKWFFFRNIVENTHYVSAFRVFIHSSLDLGITIRYLRKLHRIGFRNAELSLKKH